MLKEDAVLGFLHTKGPSTPSDLKRDMRLDTTLISAMLSNLASNKKVRISNLKFGSSPLYYLPGQEAQLVNFLNKLSQKEQAALSILKEAGVLRDSDLDPLTRVCLHQTKDFAEALTVSIGGAKHTFWKWYLTTDGEAEQKIRVILQPPVVVKPVVQEVQIETPVAPQDPKPVKELKPAKPKKIEQAQPAIEPLKEPKFKSVKKKETTVGRAVKAIKELIAPTPQEDAEVEVKEEPVLKSVTKEMPAVKNSSLSPSSSKEDLAASGAMEETAQEEEETANEGTLATPEMPTYLEDPFYQQLTAYFAQNHITVRSVECIRKKAEFDFTLDISSPIGPLYYYCKAKNKKKIAESDVSTFYVKGQAKKLPLLMLTTGDISKQAAELLEKELLGLTVKKI